MPASQLKDLMSLQLHGTNRCLGYQLLKNIGGKEVERQTRGGKQNRNSEFGQASLQTLWIVGCIVEPRQDNTYLTASSEI